MRWSSIWVWTAYREQKAFTSFPELLPLICSEISKGDCSQSPLLEADEADFESWVTDRHSFIIRSIIRSGPGQHYTWQLIYIILGTISSQIFHVHRFLLKLFYNALFLLKWNMKNWYRKTRCITWQTDITMRLMSDHPHLTLPLWNETHHVKSGW